MTSSLRSKALALASVLAVAASLLVATQSAAADTAPPVVGVPETVATDSLPTAQINGVVWDQVIIGDTVYAAGDFTKARPAGAALGVDEVDRTYLLSYTLSTGVLTSWAPVINAQVRALDVSPDGSRLYAVGQFTSVNGVTKNRIVAFNTATGAIDTAFAGSANGQIYAVTASASTVYIAGTFTAVSGIQRPGNAAAFTASTGAVLPWAPVVAGGRAFAMEVAPDESKVVLAGNFTTLNGSGNPGYGQGAVNTTDGASVTWIVGTIIRNAGPDAAIYNLDSDATSVYGTGYTFGTGGNLEGSFRASWTDGALEWFQDCKGDEYSVAVTSSAVYIAGHPHNCGGVGGFPQTNPWTWHRGIALSKNATQSSINGIFAGKPQPSALQFFPNINQGTYTGQLQGPWSVAANESYVVYAGEFTQINYGGQQGLARFAVKSIAPNKVGPDQMGAAWTIDAQSYSSDSVRLSWIANQDDDNESLTYRVFRDGATETPVYTTTVPSTFWNRPTITFVDSGLAAGATHTYKVSATDPFGNVAWSATTTATVSTTGTLGTYARDVFSNSPTYYFRLDESTGDAVNAAGPTANTTATGAVTQSTNATVGTTALRAQAGALVGDADTAMKFSNVDNNSRAFTTQQVWADDSLSVEAWFKTSTSSGKIVGFGSSATAASSGSYDRHIYLNGGKVIFGVQDTGNRTIASAPGFNDNQWHHVVGTLSSAGMALYVDGQLVGTRAETVSGQRYWGNWRIGGDNTWSGNQNFNGSIDEVAIYKVPITAADVMRHYQKGTGAWIENAAPVASFTSSTADLTVDVDASGSTDSDGTIAGYAWAFGDGATATGVTATHTYALGGTYTVTLTTTDDDGASSSVSAPVTVVVPVGGTLAQDSFTRTTASGWGTADLGGAWSAPANSSYSVGGGAASAVHTTATTRRSLLGAMSSSDADVAVNIAIDKAATGGGISAGIVARQVGASYYQARVRFLTGGAVGLQILNGSSTILANTNAVSGLTYSVGQQVRVRVLTTGTNPTTISTKAWLVGSPEPVAWQLTAADSTPALQASGSIGVESYLSGSATNAPVTARFDDLVAAVPGAPAPNSPPTASFTTTSTALGASFDGTASSDPDGTIASYAWDFGDGSSGAGATASHTYATAGTFSVALTVTDDAGATGSFTGSVTVTNPPVSSTLAQDGFDRTVAAGWGNADTGGAWSAPATSSYVVTGSTAGAIHTAGSTRRALLTAIGATTTDTTVDLSIDKVATGGGISAGIVGRQVGTAYYQARVRFVAGGTVGLQILSGSSTVLANITTISGIAYTPGQSLRLRLLTTGTNPTTMSAKVWVAGSAEPASWQLTATDSTSALQSIGSIGLESYLSASATNAPVTVNFDNLSSTQQ